ncbi:MAG: hypothetical protein JO317_01335, partial [Verrucomicrobiae bacterium]|nr:hypothetical protein [Verrucomicrobiae bacterium]
MSMSKPFDLERLLDTVFEPKPGERVAVFIDLENPRDIAGLKFLDQPDYGPQTIGYRILFQGLEALQPKMKFKSVEFYSYRATGGSNLDLPAEVFDREGRQLDLVKDVLPNLDLVIYTGTYSATAPITALARRMNFRGATMHGLNPTILKSGLSVDYRTVSRKAEAFRSRLSRSDWAEIEFEHEGQPFKLRIELSGQEAQKSHGLCPERGEIANLPAGEVYFVPTGAEGSFPIVFHDGTVA